MRLAVHGVVFFQATSSASGILKEGCVERCATRHDVPKIWGLSLWVWTMPARPQSFTTCILARRLAWRIHGTVPDIDVCNYHDLWLSSSAINVLGVNIFGSDGAFDHNSRKNRRSVQVVMTQPTIGSNAGFLVHSNGNSISVKLAVTLWGGRGETWKHHLPSLGPCRPGAVSLGPCVVSVFERPLLSALSCRRVCAPTGLHILRTKVVLVKKPIITRGCYNKKHM